MKRLASFIICLALLCVLTPAGAAGPLEITDAAGLAAIADAPEGDYVLAADIDMAGVDWLPIDFSGTLDGAGHTIFNLTVTQTGKTSYVTQDGNHKPYDTYFAGLFSKLTGGEVKNLTLLNEYIDIETDGHVFIGGVAGYCDDSVIEGCSIEAGRLFVTMSAQMFGAGGVAGYGSGTILDCSVDAVMVTADINRDIKCEGFLGGIMACGYPDIERCDIDIETFVSLDGYMHSGGIIGMHHIDDETKALYTDVANNDVSAVMHYYEHNDDPRYYCYFDFGERLNPFNSEIGNESREFISDKVYDELAVPEHILLPEECEAPDYEERVTPPEAGEFGFTTYTCKNCGYTYTDAYTVLIPVESVEVDKTELLLYYLDEADVTGRVLPENATDASITWQSSDEAVCTVDENGHVKATGKGEAYITCVSADGISVTLPVTVSYTLGQWMKIVLLFGWIWYI